MGKRQKTHEEYVSELAIKNPTIKVIGRYINASTKIMHYCLKHDVQWETTPSRALEGVGCEICKKEKFRQSRCKTHQQYVEEVERLNPNIEVVDDYIDSKTPIKHYCKKHNIFWNVMPCNVLSGCGCVECGKEKTSDKNSKTREQYIAELKIINPNVVMIDTYINATTPIIHKCLIDEYEWYVKPSNLLTGKGCPKCANNIKKTNEEYVKKVSLVNPDIEVIEEYVNSYTPIFHKCKKHNIQWKVSPSSILQGCGCLECGIEKLSVSNTKSHEQYVEELKKINPNIVVIENYIRSNIPILHKCLIDGNEWYAAPSNILFGNGCPQCNESKGERQIRLWLEDKHIVYEKQKKFEDCRDIKPLPFDFYLLRYNLCIEFDGKQHYEPIEYFGGQKNFELQQKHDIIKDEYCKNNGISLLRIPYFKNVEEELNNFLFI